MSTIETKEQFQDFIQSNPNRPWKIYVPMGDDYIEKSISGDSKSSDEKDWRIGGVASSSEEDLENEEVVPEGIDTSYFLKWGWFNSEHKKGAAFKVGIPTRAMCTRKGLEVEGYLLKDMPEAVGIYTLMKTLKKGQHARTVGFSIEGKTILQEGKRIIKSFLIDVAITANPVNPTTYADLIKSLKMCSADNSLESMSYVSVDKTLEAGHDVAGLKDGEALRVQDLERKLKILTNKGLSPDEALEYIVMKTGLDPENAKKVLKYSDILKKMSER